MNDTTNAASNQQLEPCKFCGGESVIVEFYDGDDPQLLFVATCKVCPVKTYDQFSPEEAARIWNSKPAVVAATAGETPDHAADCAWERTTSADCEYRDTHHYCPHLEHACTCPPRTKPPIDAIPEGQWQHVQIKAGNPGVVAVQFETAEQATAFINSFTATASPAAPKEEAPEVLPVPAIVHPFGPCGYLYCDWPDGELRCNEVRSTPSPDAAKS